MSCYEELQRYEKQIARKNYIKPRLPELKDKCWELEKRVGDLEKKKLVEDEDVKRLEGHSLAAFVYAIIGKKEEQLDKERREAYEATAKYNVALAELEEVKKDIHKMELDLECYVNAEKNYEETLKKWLSEMTASNLSEEQTVYVKKCQRELAAIQNQKREIKEARRAAEKAVATAERVSRDLADAHGWGVYDVIAGGLIADVGKYDCINHAEDNLSTLHTDLYHLRKELKDIKIDSHISINISNDMRVVDIFLDNIFTDFAALGEIKRSRNEVEELIIQLREVIDYLMGLDSSIVESELEATKKLADALKGGN